MLKVHVTAILSFVFLFAASIVALLLDNTVFGPEVLLLIATIIVAISGLCVYILRNNKLSKIIPLLLNAVSLGFAIRAWYVFRNLDNNLLVMIGVSLICIAFLYLFYLLTYIPVLERHCTALMVGLVLISMIIYICLIFTTKTTWLSTVAYYLVIEICFIIGMCIEVDTLGDLLKELINCSFGVVIVIVIVALCIISEGASFDLSFDFGSKLNSPRDKKIKN